MTLRFTTTSSSIISSRRAPRLRGRCVWLPILPFRVGVTNPSRQNACISRVLKKSPLRNSFLSAQPAGFGFGSIDAGDLHAWRGFPASGCEQPGQSGEVVCGHGEDEAGTHPFDAVINGLGHSADGFGPAESLFDPFAVFDRQGVTLVPGRAAVDRRVSGFLRDMRGHTGLPQVGDELGGVEALVRSP